MFTRVVELTTKPSKIRQLAETIDDKVLPVLKRQKGFVNETVFVSDKDDNRVLALDSVALSEAQLEDQRHCV